LVERTANINDQRCKLIKQTDKAEKEVFFLQQMCTHTAVVIDDLFEEIEVDLLDKISDAITSLRRNPLRERLNKIVNL